MRVSPTFIIMAEINSINLVLSNTFARINEQNVTIQTQNYLMENINFKVYKKYIFIIMIIINIITVLFRYIKIISKGNWIKAEMFPRWRYYSSLLLTLRFPNTDMKVPNHQSSNIVDLIITYRNR